MPLIGLQYAHSAFETGLLPCRDIKPNEVYNLAAQSHVGLSFKQPELTAAASGLVSAYSSEPCTSTPCGLSCSALQWPSLVHPDACSLPVCLAAQQV